MLQPTRPFSGLRLQRKGLIQDILKLICVLVLCRLSFSYGTFYCKVVVYHVVKYSLIGFLIFLANGIYFNKFNKFQFHMISLLMVFWACWDTIVWTDVTHDRIYSQNISNEQPKYFIAGNLYNNEAIFDIYSYEIERFIDMVGANNVFVSIIENYSTDKTPVLLNSWSKKLKLMGVPNRIITNFQLPKRDSLDRIERLAYIRNAVLQPFYEPESGFIDSSTINWNYTKDDKWTPPKLLPKLTNSKVIFLNDVYFFKETIVKLINTRGGDYDAVCGTDYYEQRYYDRWVARDMKGRQIAMYYPFFMSRADQRKVVNQEPVELYSCWNGMVVLDAKLIARHFSPQLLINTPFKKYHSEFKHTDLIHPRETELPGIRFRAKAQPEECYASERFFIWYDLRQNKQLKLRLYQNPGVILYYDLEQYFGYREFFNWFFFRWYKYYTYDPSKNRDLTSNSFTKDYVCWKMFDREEAIVDPGEITD